MERFAYRLPMAILVLLGCTSQDTNPREAMVFRDVNVLSMENETVLSGQTVVIIEDMIHEIGSSQEIQPVSGAVVIRCYRHVPNAGARRDARACATR